MFPILPPKDKKLNILFKNLGIRKKNHFANLLKILVLKNTFDLKDQRKGSALFFFST